jgi:arabinofuranan 3-O-arabinosyltransferase
VRGWASLAPGAARPAIGRCGALILSAGSRRVPLRIEGNVSGLEAGRPVRVSGCTPLNLAAGPQRIRVAGSSIRPDTIALTSPAPSPIARIATTAGTVTDPGDPGRGSRDNVKLAVRAPGWLVLGESYDKGWRAWCNGRPLGAPVPLDGYANAWPVEPGCTTAHFAFAPQRPVHIVQLVSAIACLLLLAIALGLRRTAEGLRDLNLRSRVDELPDRVPLRWTPGRAAVAGVAVGAVLAFCFSLRSGLLIAPAIAIVLWRGIPAAPLAAAGGLLLAVAVPLDYLVFPAPDFGGYNPGYAGDQVSGHWIAVAAWVLLALALWRVLSTARSRRGGPSAAPADAGASPTPP